MRKFVIMMVICLLAVMVQGGQLISKKLLSLESGFRGTNDYAGVFAPDTTGFVGVAAFADSLHFLQILGRKGLDPATTDLTVWVEVDTSLGATGDSTDMSIYAVPIFNWDGIEKNAISQADWRYRINLVEVVHGTSSVNFACNPDSGYAFHSNTWWNGAEVDAILYPIIINTSDSLNIVTFKTLTMSGY